MHSQIKRTWHRINKQALQHLRRDSVWTGTSALLRNTPTDMLSLPLHHIVLRFMLIHCIFSSLLPTWDDCIKARCLKFKDGILLCIWRFTQSRIALFSYSLSAFMQNARLNSSVSGMRAQRPGESPNQEARKTEGEAVRHRAAWLTVTCNTRPKPRTVWADGCCLLPPLGLSHHI